MGSGVRVQHLVPAAAVLIVLIIVAAPGSSSELAAVAAPGGPEAAGPAVRWMALGLLAAPAVMVYVHRPAAAWAAVACAGWWVITRPGYGWRELLPCAYALVAVLVAHARPPAPAHTPESARADFAGWFDVTRAHLTTRTRIFSDPSTSSSDPLEPTDPDPAHPDPAHPDLSFRGLDPNRAPAHPRLGPEHPAEEVRVARPPQPAAWPSVGGPAAGLAVAALAGAGAFVAQTLRTGAPAWLAAAVVAAGVGVALLARNRARRRALHELFSAEQPVREARVVDQLGYLHVLVPTPDGRTAVEFGMDTADTWSTWDGEPGDPRTRPATLYGEPRPGSWCAVEVDGRVHVPVEPVGMTTLITYDPEHGLPQEVTDDEEQLVDPDALLGTDHLETPDEMHEHRISPVRAWCTVAAIGLGATLAAAEGMHLAGFAGDWPSVTVVAVVAAAAFEFGWRSQLRQRLRWHAGGVVAVGFRGVVREPWTVDSAAVHDDEGAVTLTVGDSVVTVPAPPPWPRGSGQRNCEQLVAALRDARMLAFAGGPLPPPPSASVPHRPLLLVAAWAVTVTGAVALFAS
ncbi:hypothetical protein AB0M20_11720 [Actinoplanes sp. NPDC051633]|uniref:hypothetical protein n=1 Tax=Actinoplanes sp. NPDC051633 TaxID=3155670 RepID=UPI003426E50A